MKVLLSKPLLDKVKSAQKDATFIANLNDFVASIQENHLNVLNKSHQMETNIYVYKLEDIRLFFSLYKDHENNDVAVLLDFATFHAGRSRPRLGKTSG